MVLKLVRNCKMEEIVWISFFEKLEMNFYVIGFIRFILWRIVRVYNRGVLCGFWLCGYLVVCYIV